MPAQPEARRKIDAPGDAYRVRNWRVATRRLFLVLVFFALLSGGLVVRAEENGSTSLSTLSLNVALISSSSLNRGEQVRLSLDSRFSPSLKELASEREGNSALPKSFLRKQLVWRSEGPRAKVRPGFGEFFRGETVEPLRSNGAGVEDSRYLFVKFSFRF